MRAVRAPSRYGCASPAIRHGQAGAVASSSGRSALGSAASPASWHPYRFWCIRDAPPRPNTRWKCADCGRWLAHDARRDAIEWGFSFEHRMRARMIVVTGGAQVYEDESAHIPRPPGVRLVAVNVLRRF